jgi:hypothetical protein
MPFSSDFSPSNRTARLNRQLAGLFPSTKALEEQRRIYQASRVSSLFRHISISGNPQPFDIGTLISTTNTRSPPRKKPRNRANPYRPRKIQRYRKTSKPDGFESDSGFLPAVPSFGEELGPREDSGDAKKVELARYWDALRPDIDSPESWSIFRLTSEIYIVEDWDRKNETLKVTVISDFEIYIYGFVYVSKARTLSSHHTFCRRHWPMGN